MRTIFAVMVLCVVVASAGAGELANGFAGSTLKDWKTFLAAQKVSIAQDLAKDVPEKDRSISREKLAANIMECLDHLSIDEKYVSGLLGAAYPECVVPAARDFK